MQGYKGLIDLNVFGIKSKKVNSRPGFTIVELLVVIVVIGILAAITIVSYSGITNRANIASIQAELSGSARKLAMYYAQNGFYPAALDGNGCPTAPADTTNCVKFGGTTTFTYVYKTPTSYELIATRGSNLFKITENSSPTDISLNPADWLTIGTQTWAKKNLNVGTMITGVTDQSSAETAIEKYCYNNYEPNCDTYGGLYQWGEAMGYSVTEGARGICPYGSHIPTDAEWKTLEVALGMSQSWADSDSVWRLTDQGAMLKAGGSSGLDIILAGMRGTTGLFSNATSSYLWSSSQSGSTAWTRVLNTSNDGVYRVLYNKTLGHTVRCLKN